MRFRALAAAAALLAIVACSGNGGAGSGMLPTVAQHSVRPQGGAMALPGGGEPVCTGLATNGQVQCPVLINTLVGFITDAVAKLTGQIPGYHPADLRSAYNFPSTGGSGATVAIVDKGDDPNAESDLAVYRKRFGLPACTTSNGCFSKVTQEGNTNGFGPGDDEWSAEIALDLDMVSAICPQCHILLVETHSANIADFGHAVDTAVSLGATEVSNSYYTNEFGGIVAQDSHYDHPGVPITVAAGDSGYGVMFPASSEFVIAVGGTTLVRAPGTARGWAETAWSETSSGCSAYIAKPSWQTDSGCPNRTVADVAVVGDPATGVSVYNTYAPRGQQGWGVFGGTSVGAPIVAAIYALAGNATSMNAASHAYANPGSLNAITQGSDGVCSPAYLCTAGPGYDGPTGLGSPNAVGAF